MRRTRGFAISHSHLASRTILDVLAVGSYTILWTNFAASLEDYPMRRGGPASTFGLDDPDTGVDFVPVLRGWGGHIDIAAYRIQAMTPPKRTKRQASRLCVQSLGLR